MGVILGLDFGTSNTVVCCGDSVSAKADSIGVLFHEPSVVMWDARDGRYRCGLEAEEHKRFFDENSEDCEVYKYFKARVKGGMTEESRRIVTEYLTYALVKSRAQLKDKADKIIATIPTEWHKSDTEETRARKQLMEELLSAAVAAAGFGAVPVILYSESEAAAESINSLMRLSGDSTDKFMLLIDCGGGTVDFSIFMTNHKGKVRWAQGTGAYIENSTRMGSDDADTGKAGVRVDQETVRLALGGDDITPKNRRNFNRLVHLYERDKNENARTQEKIDACLEACGSLVTGRGAAEPSAAVRARVVGEYKINGGSYKKVTFGNIQDAFKKVIAGGGDGMEHYLERIKAQLNAYGKELHESGKIDLRNPVDKTVLNDLTDDERYFRVCCVGGFSNSRILQQYVKDSFGITRHNAPARWWQSETDNWMRDEAVAQGAVVFGIQKVRVLGDVTLRVCGGRDGKETYVTLLKKGEQLSIGDIDADTHFFNPDEQIPLCLAAHVEPDTLLAEDCGLLLVTDCGKKLSVTRYLYDLGGSLKNLAKFAAEDGFVRVNLFASYTLDHEVVLELAQRGETVYSVNLGNIFGREA